MKTVKLIIIGAALFYMAGCSSDDNTLAIVPDTVATQIDDTTSGDVVTVNDGIDNDSLFTLAITAYTNGDYTKAIEFFDKYVTLHPTSTYIADAIYWSALSSYKLDDVTKATAGFARIESDYVQSLKYDNAIYYLGRIEDKKGNNIEALAYYEKFFTVTLSDSTSSYRDALYYSSYINYLYDDFVKSAKGFEEYTTKFSESIKYPGALYYLARSYDRANNFDNALKSYNLFIQTGNSDVVMLSDAIYYVGYIMYQKDDFVNAITKFNTIISDYPTTSRFPDALYHVGKCYYNDSTATKSKAIDAFTKVITDSPTDTARVVDSYYYIGKSYYYSQEPNYDKSMESFRVIINNYAHDTSRFEDATYWTGKVNYAKAIVATDSTVKYELYADAQTIFEKYLTLGSTDTSKMTDAKYRIGVVDYYLGNYSRSLATFDELVSYTFTYSKYENAIYYQGKALYQLDRFNESLTSLATLITKFPETTLKFDAMFYVGLNNYKLGNYSEADAKLKDVISSGDDKYDDAIYWIALSKYKQADYTNAKVYFNRYITEFATGTYVPSCESYIAKCDTKLGL